MDTRLSCAPQSHVFLFTYDTKGEVFIPCPPLLFSLVTFPDYSQSVHIWQMPDITLGTRSSPSRMSCSRFISIFARQSRVMSMREAVGKSRKAEIFGEFESRVGTDPSHEIRAMQRDLMGLLYVSPVT